MTARDSFLNKTVVVLIAGGQRPPLRGTNVAVACDRTPTNTRQGSELRKLLQVQERRTVFDRSEQLALGRGAIIFTGATFHNRVKIEFLLLTNTTYTVRYSIF
jgi:hypothetical protein